MNSPKTFLSVWVLALVAVPPAQAQVTLDVSKITCEQYLLRKVADPEKIALWLSGYHNGKRGNTIIDVKGLEKNAERLKDQCRKNMRTTVMEAVEALIAKDK